MGIYFKITRDFHEKETLQIGKEKAYFKENYKVFFVRVCTGKSLECEVSLFLITMVFCKIYGV